MSQPIGRAVGALLIVLLIGVIFNAEGSFYKWNTHRDMYRQIAVFGILACGMTLVIISGGIDLSVGSVLAFASVFFSLLSIHRALPPIQAIPLCLLAGFGLGVISGWLIGQFRMQPFIATLAMMVFAGGLAKFASHEQKVSRYLQTPAGDFQVLPVPPSFDFLNSKVLHNNVAVVTLVFLAGLLVCWIILSKLRWGRYFYAIGGNEEAARLSGVPVRAMKVLVYGLSGLFAALGGICQAAQELQGDPNAGKGYELTAIAMVVIGGTSLAGGRGNIWLTLVGALTIGYLDKILSINAVSEAGRLMLTGGIIAAAVLLQKTKR